MKITVIPPSLHRILFAGVLLILITGLALYSLINFKPDWIPSFLVQWARQPDLLDYPEAKRCAECHESIYSAWKESRHSLAWVSETYIKDSENRSKEKCLPCHIPASVVPGIKPESRLQQRGDGIFCVPCHVRDKAMRGPYDLYSPAHPTRADKTYRTSEFCGTCHQKTFKDWQGTGSDRTCHSCHMKRRKGRLTQKLPLSWLHSTKQVADHRFPKGELSDENIKVRAEFDAGKFRVQLTNPDIPHHVPTADNGDPRLYLYLNFLNAQGESLDTYKEIMAPQQETALPFKKPVTYEFPVSAEIQSAQVVLRYKPAWSPDKSDILNRTVNR